MAQLNAAVAKQISIYAELLPNIGQVSVAAALPSPSDSSTKIALLDHGQRLQVEHKDETAIVSLPATVSPIKSSLGAKVGASVLNLRLPVSNTSPRHQQLSIESQSLPWSAMDISIGSAIRCRQCGFEIVQNGSIGVWKDLPSDNWAEMMEFWHCHKPHDHSQHDENSLERKGYGASNAIAAQPGVGLVDQISFLVSETDCRGLLFKPSTKAGSLATSNLALELSPGAKFLEVSCNECEAEVGMFTTSKSSLTLFKWAVSITTNESRASCRGPTSSECLAAILIASISGSGSAKSVIAPYIPPNAEEAPSTLNVWVLNSNVTYTASSLDRKRTALKVLYRVIDAEAGNRLVESVNSDVQDISFPGTALDPVLVSLKASTLLLPEPERTFKDWRVGLLDRWSPYVT